MRARLTMKLVSIVVLLVLTVMGARSCSGSSKSSPIQPDNVARNGISAVCANEQATQDADGAGSAGQTPPTVVSGSELSELNAQNPGGVEALDQALGGDLSCPNTTTAPAGAGS